MENENPAEVSGSESDILPSDPGEIPPVKKRSFLTKKFLLLSFLIVVLLGVVIGSFVMTLGDQFYSQTDKTTDEIPPTHSGISPTEISCESDSKLVCPDGSLVGKRAPSCRYDACSAEEKTVIDSKSGWRIYTIRSVGVTFHLPAALTKKYVEILVPSSTGNIVCFSEDEFGFSLIPKASAGGVGICDPYNSLLVITAKSADYSAQRGPNYADVAGYTTKGSAVYFDEKLVPQAIASVYTNPHNLSFSIISFPEDAEPPDDDSPASDYLFQPGTIGAKVESSNPAYPQIYIFVRQKMSVEEFKKILSTFVMEKS